MGRRRQWLIFAAGAVFAAIVFAPLAGAFGALFWFTGSDGPRDDSRVANRIVETVLPRRPDWIPHSIALGQGARWPAPEVAPDQDCLSEVGQIARVQRVAIIEKDDRGGVPAPRFPGDMIRESLDRELRIARRSPAASNLEAAMVIFDSETSLLAVEVIERSALLDMPDILIGALDGCLHISLAAPLCAHFARDRVERNLARYRAPIETLFLANGARVQNMACAALHGLAPPARQIGPASR